ncbi:MAG: 3-deoxy-8-phosphooctulonate synthase [Candidatus Omnitrophica bacterium]|nr:3-deoxy-8-phosphooctulonate synthase [Candidatus Omnitrophota bacterium]
MVKTVSIDKIKFGGKENFVLISGPCVIESRTMVLSMAKRLKEITSRVGIPFVFKASYDKANRTSYKSFRGPGLEKGLDILQEVKQRVGVPVTSDIHTVEEVAPAAKVLDILQIPAFLCRQTDLLTEAGKSKKVVNVKKGQFLAPWDMAPAIRKIEKTGNKRILVTERGTSFGYNTLVTDFRSVPIMQDLGYPVVMDVSHSVQQPGGLGEATGGKSEYIPLLARCAVAAGCNAIFMETHPDPKKALSDGPNMLPLGKMEKVLKELKAIKKAMR